jgi:hypothetical protein
MYFGGPCGTPSSRPGSVGVRGRVPSAPPIDSGRPPTREGGLSRLWCSRPCPPVTSRAPMRSAASRARAGRTWLWVFVVVRSWLWPSSSMTARGRTFSLSSRVAAVCRPSCRRPWRTPALGAVRPPLAPSLADLLPHRVRLRPPTAPRETACLPGRHDRPTPRSRLAATGRARGRPRRPGRRAPRRRAGIGVVPGSSPGRRRTRCRSQPERLLTP